MTCRRFASKPGFGIGVRPSLSLRGSLSLVIAMTWRHVMGRLLFSAFSRGDEVLGGYPLGFRDSFGPRGDVQCNQPLRLWDHLDSTDWTLGPCRPGLAGYDRWSSSQNANQSLCSAPAATSIQTHRKWTVPWLEHITVEGRLKAWRLRIGRIDKPIHWYSSLVQAVGKVSLKAANRLPRTLDRGFKGMQGKSHQTWSSKLRHLSHLPLAREQARHSTSLHNAD